jgi:hypothetical protein
MILPPRARPLLDALAPTSTRPTFNRPVVLPAAAILAQGRHTVADLLRTLGAPAPGHRTDCQRPLSRSPRSGPGLGCSLARFIVGRIRPAGPVLLVGDDTVDGRPGRRAYGKARRRDPVRSSHACTAWKYGHRRVVPAVPVRFPRAARPRAPPVLVDRYRSGEDDRRRRRPRRTPARLMCRLLRAPLIRLPGRRFAFVGDGGFGAHEVARLAHRHRGRLVLVGELRPEANPSDPPPPHGGAGRPRVEGGRRPKPRGAVAAACRRRRLTVGRYGRGTRRVAAVTGTGRRYKAGGGLAPLRRVPVHDLEGTHRDEYSYTADPATGAAAIVARYAGRWNFECTSQEGRPHLRSGTARGWSRRAVSRATPRPFGPYSVVAPLFDAMPGPARAGGASRPGEAGMTSSGAPAAVRLRVRSEGVFRQAATGRDLNKLPEPVRELLSRALAPAA